jgi:hypothetical protein
VEGVRGVNAAFPPLLSAVGLALPPVLGAAFPDTALAGAVLPGAAFLGTAFPDAAFPGADFLGTAFPDAAFLGAALPPARAGRRSGNSGIRHAPSERTHIPFTERRKALRATRERVTLNGKMSGGVLLSHAVARAVPSAQRGLASGFGMGPGVSLSL